jgi:hypothetical protein
MKIIPEACCVTRVSRSLGGGRISRRPGDYSQDTLAVSNRLTGQSPSFTTTNLVPVVLTSSPLELLLKRMYIGSGYSGATICHHMIFGFLENPIYRQTKSPLMFHANLIIKQVFFHQTCYQTPQRPVIAHRPSPSPSPLAYLALV